MKSELSILNDLDTKDLTRKFGSNVSLETLCHDCGLSFGEHKGLDCPLPPALARKQRPVATGVLDYFPDAILEVSRVSFVGNEQHNPGSPLHWDRAKSTDEADALMRHMLQRGTRDTDGLRHTAKVAWRALALLQKEIEADRAKGNS